MCHALPCVAASIAGLAAVEYAHIRPSVLKFADCDRGADATTKAAAATWAAEPAPRAYSAEFGVGTHPFSVALAPSETVAAVCCRDNTVRLARLPDCRVVREINVCGPIEDCCWAGETTLLVTLADEGGVRVFKADGTVGKQPPAEAGEAGEGPLFACAQTGGLAPKVYFGAANSICECDAALNFVRRIEPAQFLEGSEANDFRNSDGAKITQLECIGTGFLFVGFVKDMEHGAVVIDLEKPQQELQIMQAFCSRTLMSSRMNSGGSSGITSQLCRTRSAVQ